MATIREASPTDAEAIAEVHVTSWRESYETIIPRTILDVLSVDERTERWRKILAEIDRQPLYVAEKDGQVVGFAEGGNSQSDALGQEKEIYAIYLLSQAKRQGLGTKLLRAVVSDFIQQGANSAGLWVFKDNHPARRFYEHFGAHLVVEKVNNRFGRPLLDLGYVWTDLGHSFSKPPTS